ncbi:hypothetical protein AOA61_01910 [Pseudomonas sp. 2995-1]|nr:hypothetical protein AOA61_01910 [Pseudomonas sp. 2995-1]
MRNIIFPTLHKALPELTRNHMGFDLAAKNNIFVRALNQAKQPFKNPVLLLLAIKEHWVTELRLI